MNQEKWESVTNWKGTESGDRQKLEKLLQQSGYQVIMTRTKDEMLCSREVRNKKGGGLKETMSDHK